MKNFVRGIARIDGHTRIDTLERKVELLIKEVIDVGRIVDIMAGNYVLERQKKAEGNAK